MRKRRKGAVFLAAAAMVAGMAAPATAAAAVTGREVAGPPASVAFSPGSAVGRTHLPGGHRIPAMLFHLPVLDHDAMDPAPALYMIRIKGDLGAILLSALTAMPEQQNGPYTVLTGLLD